MLVTISSLPLCFRYISLCGCVHVCVYVCECMCLCLREKGSVAGGITTCWLQHQFVWKLKKNRVNRAKKWLEKKCCIVTSNITNAQTTAYFHTNCFFWAEPNEKMSSIQTCPYTEREFLSAPTGVKTLLCDEWSQCAVASCKVSTAFSDPVAVESCFGFYCTQAAMDYGLCVCSPLPLSICVFIS